MSKRLVEALTPSLSTVLDGATVTAVGTDVVDIDLLGNEITDVPYLGSGWTPVVDDVVSVLVSGARVLVLGPVAPGGGRMPYRMAAVTGEFVSRSGASSYTETFTWPAGAGFTQAPVCTLTNVGGSGSSAFYIQMNAAPTTSGGTVLALHRDGSTASITSLKFHVVGIQMTPSSATG